MPNEIRETSRGDQDIVVCRKPQCGDGGGLDLTSTATIRGAVVVQCVANRFWR